jgi:hypothetical protein
MGVGEVKRTARAADRAFGADEPTPILRLGQKETWTAAGSLIERLDLSAVVDTRIKPYREHLAEQERRAAQRRAFVRNQTVGLVVLAAAICAWWLFHTNPGWIFPPGWWRL